MALGSGWGHDGVTYDGKEMRQHTEALAGHNGIAQTPGVTWGLKVTQQAAPATTVRVAAGAALVMADGAGLFGVSEVPNDASLNSPAFTATSANGRWDRLILRVTAGVAALEIVQGTASGSPAEPTITGNNYLELAKVLLPGSTTNITDAMITDKRVFIGKWAQPWGQVGFASWTTDQSKTAGAPSDIASATVTWTAVANRRYKSTINGHTYGAGAANDVTSVYLTDGAGSAKNRWDAVSPSTTLASVFQASFRETGIAAGSTTRKLQIALQVGVGPAHFFADANRIASLLVEDVGPSANPD